MTKISPFKVCVIGGGPAGLMACEQVLKAGHEVHLFEKMPSLGRKFLMAGKSGLNITHGEPLDDFVNRYPNGSKEFKEMISEFGPKEICEWVKSHGIKTFEGTSGRIFPIEKKAAPLLRAWIRKMRSDGLQVHVRHEWQGWTDEGAVIFEAHEERKVLNFDAYVFAMGGKSWARLGSDGKWADHFEGIIPFRPRNCGFEVSWSKYMEKHFAQPVKTVGLNVGEEVTKGDFVLTPYGVEGSAVYTLSRPLDLELQAYGKARLYLDFFPDRSESQLLEILQKPMGKKSLTSVLKNRLGLEGVKLALLFECSLKEVQADMKQLASIMKKLPLIIKATRPIDEAISTAGGFPFNKLNDHLMIKSKPGCFMAGEMLDWEAPTGGYLLTACFATGYRAGNGVVAYLSKQQAVP